MNLNLCITKIPVPKNLQCHLRWWGCKNILQQGTSLHPPQAQVLMFTDASTEGWGVHCEGEDAQGTWDPIFIKNHINVLELRTILFALEDIRSLNSE